MFDIRKLNLGEFYKFGRYDFEFDSVVSIYKKAMRAS
jgi:hypothetical protein